MGFTFAHRLCHQPDEHVTLRAAQQTAFYPLPAALLIVLICMTKDWL